ncbi:hypothetical protein J6590_040738 [Homalodisca vitripennis]|nr:hypothetical protein J6590_040738 [Homalodisca vitripennis]
MTAAILLEAAAAATRSTDSVQYLTTPVTYLMTAAILLEAAAAATVLLAEGPSGVPTGVQTPGEHGAYNTADHRPYIDHHGSVHWTLSCMASLWRLPSLNTARTALAFLGKILSTDRRENAAVYYRKPGYTRQYISISGRVDTLPAGEGRTTHQSTRPYVLAEGHEGPGHNLATHSANTIAAVTKSEKCFVRRY